MKKLFLGIMIGAILLAGLGVRLFKVDQPLADHHSWRQADTAAVARNFVQEGFTFFRPKIDNMTYLHAPDILNPERLFLAEPPVYNTLVAGFYRLLGVREAYARAVSILFSLGSVVMVYLLLAKTHDRATGLVGAFFMAFLPYGIYYGRVILPEPMMVFLTLVWLYAMIVWTEAEARAAFWLAVGTGAVALTQKAFPVFLGLPLAALVVRRWRGGIFQPQRLLKLAVMIMLIFLPFVGWRWWVSRSPEGVPPFDWLFNQGGIRFRPAFFRWIFAERIGKLIFGYWILPLFVLGVVRRPGKIGLFYHWWLLAFFLYVTVLAAGNVTHDYYQIPFLPIASIFLSVGVVTLWRNPGKIFLSWLARGAVIGMVVLGLSFSWFEVREFYNLQGGVDVAGLAVQELTPPEALVLTGDSNDSTLLYNTNRRGLTGGYASYFPNTSEHVEKARRLGASYYVTTKINEIDNTAFGQWLLGTYQLIARTDQYVLVKLEERS